MAKKRSPQQKKTKVNAPSIKSIKSSVTKQLTKVRTLITLVERLLSSERTNRTITALGGYQAQLCDALLTLEGMPDFIEEMLQEHPLLDNLFNREDMEKHLELRGYAALKERLLAVMEEFDLAAQAVKTSSSSGHSSHSTPKKSDSSESRKTEASASNLGHSDPILRAKNPLDGDSSTSSQRDAEFIDLLTTRMGSIEQTQTILLESNDLIKKVLNNLQLQLAGISKNANGKSIDPNADGESIGLDEAPATKSPNSIPKSNEGWQCTGFNASTGRPVFNPVPTIDEHDRNCTDQHQNKEVFSEATPPTSAGSRVSTLNNSSSQVKPSPILATNTINSISNTIAPFDGNSDDYPLFRQMFDLLVHENDEIPITMKHALLLKLLIGEAKTMMRSPGISSEDYNTLRENLDRQFNNTIDSKRQHIDQLSRFSFDEENFDTIEKQLNQYCVLANTLRTKGCNIDDPIFLDNFIQKLPEKIMSAVFKKNQGKERTFKELTDYTYQIITEKRAIETARDRKKTMIRSSEVYAFQTKSSHSEQENNKVGRNFKAYKCHYCDKHGHTALRCELPLQRKLKVIENKKDHASYATNVITPVFAQGKQTIKRINQEEHLTIVQSYFERRRTEPPQTINSELPNNVLKSSTHRVPTTLQSATSSSSSHRLESSNHVVLNSSTNQRSVTTKDSSESTKQLSAPTAGTNSVHSSNGKNNLLHNQFQLVGNSESLDSENIITDSLDKNILRINVCRDIKHESTLPFMILRTPQGHTLLALVDSGASTSIISTQAASKLNLKVVGQQSLNFSGFLTDSQQENCSFYRLEVMDHRKKRWAAILPSYDKMHIRFIAPTPSKTEYQELEELQIDTNPIKEFQRFDGLSIDILLGNNILGNMKPKMYTLSSGRLVTRTTLGTIVYPPVKTEALVQVHHINQTNVSGSRERIVAQNKNKSVLPCKSRKNMSNTKLSQLVEQLWNLELMGMEPPEIVNNKKKLNEELIESFKKSSTRDESNIIQVAFPFNGRESQLKDNLAVAIKRLESLLRSQSENVRKAYHDIIVQQQTSGIIEEVTDDMESIGPTYYIPHRVVVKEDSNTTKLRIVLDASSHAKGELSLNDCIHPGPSILQKIMGILIRSRLSKYLFISDLEKAYHNVRVQSKYRNATRFLWLKDPTKGPTKDNIVIYRFTRLPFGVTCSPFLLAITILLYLDIDPSPINEKIVENLYVDNILVTSNDFNEVQTFYDQLKTKFAKMHMNAREFLCNSEEVMQVIKSEDCAPSRINKLLGHIWNSVMDTITIKIATPPTGTPTKKEIVAFLAKNYDPTGIIAPLVVQVKKLIVLLWEHDLKWKDPIPESLMPMWLTITKQFTDTAYTVPRQLVSEYNYSSVQLIIFSDASKDHYATAAYLRFSYPDRSYRAQLISAKSRIKPGRVGITIPQLELLALQTATNMAITLIAELHLTIEKVTFFSDNTCVLYWVLHRVSSQIGLKWAANRVATIHANLQKLTELQLNPEVRYVPTSVNPADIATRGSSLQDLKNNELWHQGPTFLKQDEKFWPKTLETSPEDVQTFHLFVSEDTNQVLSRELHGNNPSQIDYPSQFVNSLQTEVVEDLPIVPYSRTHNLLKLVTITNYVLKFVHNCIAKRNNRFQDRTYLYQSSTLKNYEDAAKDNDEVKKRRITRNFIIKYHYDDAKDRLGLQIPERLRPKLDTDELYHHIRPFVNSKHHEHTDAMENPIIIIGKHPLALLLVMESHIAHFHQGVKDVISDIQRKYWIEKIGTLVRKVRKKCITCQKIHGKPFKYPYAEVLPSIRSQLVCPFAFIGLDYFGPLRYKAKNEDGKVWVLLVTCLVTRAVHLEIVQDNTTHSFLLALKRYFGRRGVPQTILSDNAPTFKLGYKMVNSDIKTMINKSLTLTSFLAEKEIEIKLITPFSPWQGGIYERIVALVKNMINKVIGKIRVSYLELESLLIEAEGILNSRPITTNKIHISDAEPIRPVDFLITKAFLAIPESYQSIAESIKPGETEKNTRRLIESLAAVRESLWNVFAKEYFALLRESTIRPAAHSDQKPTPGTIVLIVTEKVPRYQWPIGVIQKLVPSEDGQIRKVEVNCGTKTLRKSVSHLIPLEVPIETEQHKHLVPDTQDTIKPDASASTVKLMTSRKRSRRYLHRKAKEDKSRIISLVSSSTQPSTSESLDSHS